MMAKQSRNLTAMSVAALIILGMAEVAHANSWYLMAADEKKLSEPGVAAIMYRGSSVGPLSFVSRGEFESRSQCELNRRKLINDFRKHSVIAHGGWAKHGISTPSVFTQCVLDDDPRLVKMPAGSEGKRPTMDILLHTTKALR